MDISEVKGFRVGYFNVKEFRHLKEEIFNQGIYDIRLGRRDPRIIDAGAHIGLSTLFFKSQYPGSHITAIEPNPETFKLLRTNIEQNNIENVTLLNKALDSKERTMDLYTDPTEDKWDSTAGFIPGGWEGGHNTKQIKVPTITLSSLIRGTKIDLLKLDIEGAEQRVLIEAKKYLENISNIVLEYHPVDGQNEQKVLKILRGCGFRIMDISGERLKIIKAQVP